MAFKFVFLRTPKPRRFYHKPIYWDPEKEEREENIADAKKKAGIRDENEPYKPSIKRGSFRRLRFEEQPKLEEAKKIRRKSNLRFLLIFIILVIIAFFLYL